jgi:transposase-like protein
VTLAHEVECDAASVSAGHKGPPEGVKSKERTGRQRPRKGQGGRGALEKERPPVLGMIDRGGQGVINLLGNVKQKTIEPFLKATLDPGTLGYTDEDRMYARLGAWGDAHKSVNPGRGEFARDEAGDGFCEGRVNTLAGFWSLVRSWRRPQRGISQEKLPLSLGFFEFVHTVRKRGHALRSALLGLLVS